MLMYICFVFCDLEGCFQGGFLELWVKDATKQSLGGGTGFVTWCSPREGRASSGQGQH